MMMLTALVRQVQSEQLLVWDSATRQEVLVHTNQAFCFRSGEWVCIHWSGVMTASIPPQITATRIDRICR